MGACISTSTVYTSRPKDISNSVNPWLLGINSENPPFIRRGFSPEYQKKQSRVYVKEILSSLEQRRVLYDNFWTSSTANASKPVFVDRSTTKSAITSFSSSLQSDSDDTGSLVTNDGLNNKAKNRCDIAIEILKAEIHFGADPKVLRTHGDRTCLMVSVLADDMRFTKRLVEQGVDVNQTNSLGETALGLAIQSQNYKLANYLRSKGAADVVLSLQ